MDAGLINPTDESVSPCEANLFRLVLGLCHWLSKTSYFYFSSLSRFFLSSIYFLNASCISFCSICLFYNNTYASSLPENMLPLDSKTRSILFSTFFLGCNGFPLNGSIKSADWRLSLLLLLAAVVGVWSLRIIRVSLWGF